MAGEIPLLVILLITGIGSAGLVTLAGMALYRRRSLSHFLVTVAIGTLLLRTFLGGVTMGGFMSMHTHHVIEHFLDAVVIGLLFAAVYVTRSIDTTPELADQHSTRHD